jgi:hypothetical protein
VGAHGVATNAPLSTIKAENLSVMLFGTTLAAMASGIHRREGCNMGYVEVYNIDKDGQWQDLNDIPFITTVNCQLCNELTEAHDIIVTARIVDGEVVAGTWQCKKCKAVNG